MSGASPPPPPPLPPLHVSSSDNSLLLKFPKPPPPLVRLRSQENSASTHRRQSEADCLPTSASASASSPRTTPRDSKKTKSTSFVVDAADGGKKKIRRIPSLKRIGSQILVSRDSKPADEAPPRQTSPTKSSGGEAEEVVLADGDGELHFLRYSDGRQQLTAGTFKRIAEWLFLQASESKAAELSSFFVGYRATVEPQALFDLVEQIYVKWKQSSRTRAIDDHLFWFFFHWAAEASSLDFTNSTAGLGARALSLLFAHLVADDYPFARLQLYLLGTGDLSSSTDVAVLSKSSSSLASSSSSSSSSSPSSVDDMRLLRQYSAEQIARELTLLDWEIVSQISPREVFMHALGVESALLNTLVDRFNRLCSWVVATIVTAESSKAQKRLWTLFVGVAVELLAVKNYNSAMIVCLALSNSALDHLKGVRAALGKSTLLLVEQLDAFSSPLRNFEGYRKTAAAHDFFVPYIPLMLRDLLFVHDGNPSYLEAKSSLCGERLVNFAKIQQITDKLVAWRVYAPTPAQRKQQPYARFLDSSSPELRSYLSQCRKSYTDQELHILAKASHKLTSSNIASARSR